MNYELVVRPEAALDIEDAFEWYENQAAGLGRDFVLAARTSINKIAERPFSFPILFGYTRRFVMDRFPYSVFFIVTEDVVTIIACVHQSRHPRTWQSRK